MSEAPLTVGQTVARARTDAGMTVAQVAGTTRIRATVISAIEDDDFRHCGGDVYARGHLKSIATAIGIDPIALATQFDTEHGATRTASLAVAPIVQPTHLMDHDSGSGYGLASLAGTLGASVSGGRRGANWTAVMALALAVIVGVGVISVLNRPSGSSGLVAEPTTSSSSTAAAGTPSSQPSTPATTAPSTTPSSAASPPDVIAAADGVVVNLAVTGRASWVRVTNAAAKTLFEGTLTKGETKVFRDKTKVKLVVGNAGAISLNVNGHDLGQPGSGGQVVKVEFGPGDPTQTAG